MEPLMAGHARLVSLSLEPGSRDSNDDYDDYNDDDDDDGDGND